MLGRIDNAQELYNFKLGSALTMENKTLDILDANIEEAQDESLKQLFRHHQDETRQQISNIEQAFGKLGWDVDDKPCPSMEALEQENKAEANLAAKKLKDAVVLGGASETEHHEIAMYENLITGARAMGRDDVASLLQQNMEQEQHTLQEVQNASQRVSQQIMATA
jgi:ferritin-like metal-binding protein YciE